VSKAVLARYYLHSLENMRVGQAKPQLGYFEIPQTGINLEHVMPDRPCPGWEISQSDAQSFHRRLGNMALLAAKENVKNGVKPFSEKVQAYSESTYLFTQDIADASGWTGAEITQRQEILAQLAAKTWPL
jgi:hypothetical protein